eukprot:g566.t1 g566   contig10:300384-301073(-)
MVQSLKCTGLHTRQVIIPNCVDSAQHCNRTYHLFLPSILCSGSSDRDLLNEGIDQWYTPEEDTADRRHINNNRHVQRYTAFNEYFEGEHHNVGTIPMVFVLHDLGVDAQSMTDFIPYADTHHLILVLPEGLDNSFNAGKCCGYAEQHDIFDVEFLLYIQQQLSEEFTFIQPEMSYGVGWGNGAFLLTYALKRHQLCLRR